MIKVVDILYKQLLIIESFNVYIECYFLQKERKGKSVIRLKNLKEKKIPSWPSLKIYLEKF